jgi:uncharacterized protein (UPF0332 family)
MAVLNPTHLLEQAERLLEPRGSRVLIRQADRRRAISAAYYAVFHFTLIAVADQFVGRTERKAARYALAYRSIDHNKLEGLCRVASSAKIDTKSKYAKFIPENGFGGSVREFSSLLLELKEKRNAADYDPSHWVKIADARRAISAAQSAIQQFENAHPDETIAFLSLLVFPPR